MFNNFDKINFLHISDIELAKIVRKEIGVNLRQALITARGLKAAFNMGVIRGKVVKNA